MATKKTTTKKTTATATVAKKAAAKKATPKKVATIPVAKKAPRRRASPRAKKTVPVVAPPEKAFWMCDGTVVHSLLELATALEGIKKDTFTHHVSKDKNDFARWVEDVLQDPTGAAALVKAKTVPTTKRAVQKRLQSYGV